MTSRFQTSAFGPDLSALKAAAFDFHRNRPWLSVQTAPWSPPMRLPRGSLDKVSAFCHGDVSAPPATRLGPGVPAQPGPGRERTCPRAGGGNLPFGLPSFEADGAAVPLGDGSVLLTLHVKGGHLAVERGGAEAAGLRTIVGLGRMLAHEIKNSLAGIRGAAQLLKAGARSEDTPLAQLIVDETDRVRRLVDRMEAFSDDALPDCKPINIHQVLDRVRALAANGVADGLVLRERYDPSLPLTPGDEDQLIQVFLNLVKNAAEAAHSRGDNRGEIVIQTAFRHGVRIRATQGQNLRGAPLRSVFRTTAPGCRLICARAFSNPL